MIPGKSLIVIFTKGDHPRILKESIDNNPHTNYKEEKNLTLSIAGNSLAPPIKGITIPSESGIPRTIEIARLKKMKKFIFFTQTFRLEPSVTQPKISRVITQRDWFFEVKSERNYFSGF